MQKAVDMVAGFEVTLFTNEYLPIVEYRVPPGAEVKIRPGGFHLYALNDHSLKTTNSEGFGTVHTIRTGNAYSFGHEPRFAENVGRSSARFLRFSRSMRALPSCAKASTTSKPNDSFPDSVTTLLDTDEIRMLLLELAPGRELPDSMPANWSLYPLGSFTLGKGPVAADYGSAEFDEGSAYWGMCRPLASRNLSDESVRNVVFELKPR